MKYLLTILIIAILVILTVFLVRHNNKINDIIPFAEKPLLTPPKPALTPEDWLCEVEKGCKG